MKQFNIEKADNITTISIRKLQSLKVYSPIYDTTFDLMTWEQMKHQLDVWVEEGNKIIDKYKEK